MFAKTLHFLHSCARIGLFSLLCLLTSSVAAASLPSFDQVRAAYRPSETLLLSREGEILQRVRTDAQVRRGQWLALDAISPALRTALLLSEDKRFYEHSGIDWTAVSAAAWGNVWHKNTRGASTLTMQLAGLLAHTLRSGRRSVTQKISQALAARQLEQHWRKDQILEAYLNLVPFRGEIVGMDALARTLFGKAAHGLDTREAAVTAALVRAPNAPAAQVAKRACEVLRKMPQTGSSVDICYGMDFFTTAALQRRAFAASEGIAPHFARQMLRRQSPLPLSDNTLTTTLSAPLQRLAVHTLTRHVRELRQHHVHDAALVVLDNASGEVLAWVGSSGALSQAAEVDTVLARRQPGSTLKPFLYAQAIAEKRLTAASLVEDTVAQINTGAGLYIPQNYDKQFKGWVSVRTALAASLNVPAVRTLVMVTPEAFFDQLQALGLSLPQTAGWYGYSLALGSSEVSLLQLTNAYRTLANGGRASPVAFDFTPQPMLTPVLDAGAAFIVADILSDANARVRTFGLDSVLTTRFWSAVKTGTSKDMRDNWAIGWSQHYTVGVWMGNADGSAMHDVSGTSGAAPVWAEIMRWLHQTQASHAPTAPVGLIRQTVQYGPPAGTTASQRWIESQREEWFLAGTQQSRFALDDSAATTKKATTAARIVAPPSGTIIALDPDIPPARQRLHFRADHPAVQWRIPGQPKGMGSGAHWSWLPWPGRHRVELSDANGQLLDAITIEVRGAGVREN